MNRVLPERRALNRVLPERRAMNRVLPERRATLQVLGVALALAAICWYFGADLWYSILIGGALTTVGLFVAVAGADTEVGNPDPLDLRRADRNGSRNDVAQLSSSLKGSYGRVGGNAVWRLQQLARRRLEAHQLNLLDPNDRVQIEALIGRRAYAVLNRGRRRPPFLRTYVHCLDALEVLRPHE